VGLTDRHPACLIIPAKIGYGLNSSVSNQINASDGWTSWAAGVCKKVISRLSIITTYRLSNGSPSWYILAAPIRTFNGRSQCVRAPLG